MEETDNTSDIKHSSEKVTDMISDNGSETEMPLESEDNEHFEDSRKHMASHDFTGLVSVVKSHGNMKVDIMPNQSIYASNEVICGQMFLHCTSRDLKLRTISVELTGTEVVQDESMDNGVGQHVFAKQVFIIQSTDSSPTDAVMADSMRDENGYWPARKRTTQFDFNFNLPKAVPSSILTSLGNISYQISCFIEFRSVKDVAILKKSHPITVMEARTFPDYTNRPLFAESKQVWGMMRGKGEIKARCEVKYPVVLSGNQAFVSIKIDNESNVPVNQVSLALIRRLKTFRELDKNNMASLHFSRKVLHTEKFKGKEFGFDGRTVMLHLPIPREAYTVSSAKLLDISYVIQASCTAGFSKDLNLEVPIEICPASSIKSPLSMTQSVVRPSPVAKTEKQEKVEKVEPVGNVAISSSNEKVDSAFGSVDSLEDNEVPEKVASKMTPTPPRKLSEDARNRALAHLKKSQEITADE